MQWTLPNYEELQTIDAVQVANMFGRTDDLYQIPVRGKTETTINQ